MPKLVHEYDLHADLTIDDVGAGPLGRRVIFNAVSGRLTGERLNGSIVGASGDWLLLGDDGFGRLDVRITVQTDDGARIYSHHNGLIQVTAAGWAVLEGADTSTDYGDQYFFTSPQLETGDQRYTWVNQTVFLGEGRVVAGPAVEYRVYRVTGD